MEILIICVYLNLFGKKKMKCNLNIKKCFKDIKTIRYSNNEFNVLVLELV